MTLSNKLDLTFNLIVLLLTSPAVLCLFFSVCYKLHKESNLLDATRELIQQVHVLTSQTNFSQVFYVLTVVKTSRIGTHHNVNFTKALHSKSFRSKKVISRAKRRGTLLLYTSSFNRQITVTTLVNLHEYGIEFGPIAFRYVTYSKQECVSAVQFFLPILGVFCHVNLPPKIKNDCHYTG